MTKEVMKPVSAATKSSPRVGTSIERFGVKAIGPISPRIEKAAPRMVTTLAPRGEMAQPFLRSPFETRKNTTGFSERKVPKATFREARPIWKASREKTAIKQPVMSFQIAKELAIKQARPGDSDRKPEVANKSDWKILATPKPEVTIFTVPMKKIAEQKVSTLKRAQNRQRSELPVSKSQSYQARRREYNPVPILPRFEKIIPQWEKSQARKPEQNRQHLLRTKLDKRQITQSNVINEEQRKPVSKREQWPRFQARKSEWRPTTEWKKTSRRTFERLGQSRRETKPTRPDRKKGLLLPYPELSSQQEITQRQQHIQEVRQQLKTISQAKPKKEQSLSAQQKSKEQHVVSLQELQDRLKKVTSQKVDGAKEKLQAKMIKRQCFEPQQLEKLRQKQLQQKQIAQAEKTKHALPEFIRDEDINKRRINSLKQIFKALSRNRQPVEARELANRIPKQQPIFLKSRIVHKEQDDHSLEWFKMEFGQSRTIRSVEDVDLFGTMSAQRFPAAARTRGKGDLNEKYVEQYVLGQNFVKPNELTD